MTAPGTGTAEAAKVYTRGTHRVRPPEETWRIMEPKLSRYGVSRVADVTGLDQFQIPVAMAVRPLAWTLSVSQGKGQTLELAKISAAMEAVELWHAERAAPEVVAREVDATTLEVPYSVSDLGVVASPLLDDHSPLDWVAAEAIASGETVPVPLAAVCFSDPSQVRWTPSYIRANSNGLASGNSREEAAVHALYEVIERDALSRPAPQDMGSLAAVVPDSLADPVCRDMVERIRGADGRLGIQLLPSPLGVPTFRCVLWSWDFPLVCSGFGCHSDPVIALSRAITEAAQGRLATISGSRDDLEHFHETLDRPQRRAERLAAFPEPTASFEELTEEFDARFTTTTDELAWLVDRVGGSLGHEPLLVDLSTDPDFAVVKVLVPGGRLDVERIHPRAERPA